MEKLFQKSLAVLFISMAMISCDSSGDDVPDIETSSTYSPILMKRSDLEQSVKQGEARTLRDPGKIYTYGNYIFISERFEGIHVIDNSDPSNPVNISFITIPGCVDMAVKDKVMYADNAVDLVSLSIENISDIKVLNRTPNVFPELVPPDLTFLPDAYKSDKRPENTIIIGWKKS